MAIQKNSRDDVYFDEQKIEDCIKFIEKWYFPTLPFQRFIIANIVLIDKNTDEAFFTEFAIFMGRGGGKNGLLPVTIVTNTIVITIDVVTALTIKINSLTLADSHAR